MIYFEYIIYARPVSFQIQNGDCVISKGLLPLHEAGSVFYGMVRGQKLGALWAW